MYALSERRIENSGKTVFRLGIMILAIAVFSGQNMSISAYQTGTVLKGYIQENTMRKEQNDALFLLEEKWNKELKAKYGKVPVKKLETGVVYVSMSKYINSRRIKLNVSEINRNLNPQIEIIPQLSSNKIHSRSKIKNIALGSKSLIAVNGTYFKQDTGTPLGTLMINKEIITGPIYDRAVFAISENGYSTARAGFYGSVKSKGEEKIKIDGINQPRMSRGQVIIYTNRWGAMSPVTSKGVKQLIIKDNKITAISNKSSVIPYNGYVITLPSEKLNGIKSGEKIEVNYRLTRLSGDVNHIISGGPYLMKAGKIYIDTAPEKLTAITGRNPRTAVGYTKNNVMIIVTVEGRKEGSSGVTLTELAKIMSDLGCYEAINLDGGSSTVMYAGGSVMSGSNIKTSAMISNALTVRINKNS